MSTREPSFTAPGMTGTDYRNIRPVVPVRPLLPACSNYLFRVGPVGAVVDLPSVEWLTNGRSALAHAAMLSGVGRGSSVLLPAYHCESMVAPFAWLGADARLYRLHKDLSVDLEHLLSISDESTRLVLFPHYFGHLRSSKELYQICQRHGWTLVEDCAHAFFSVGEHPFFGIHSDYAVASASKFFAAFDGGVLASRHPKSGWIIPQQLDLRSQFQACMNAFEYSAEYGRFRILSSAISPLLRLLRSMHQRARRGATDFAGEQQPASRYGGVEFEPEHVNLGASYLARFLACHSNRRRIASARRSNWQFFRDRLSVCSHISFPIAELGDRDVPYVLGVEVDNPEQTFPNIKLRGIPVYRWETAYPGTDSGACANSARFRRTLIQLPCHQGLTQDERHWIVESLLSSF